MELAAQAVAHMIIDRTIDTVVVVQTAFLGDVLLTLPLLKACVDAFPSARVKIVTTPSAAQAIDRVQIPIDIIPFDKRGADKSADGLRRVAEACQVSAKSMVFVPHKSYRSAQLVRRMRHARAIVTWSDAHTASIATHVISYPYPMHEADRSLWLLSPFCTSVPAKEYLTPIALFSEDERAWLQGLALPESYVALAPGSVWPTKRWPSQYWNDLAFRCLQSGLGVVLLGDASVQGCIATPGVIDLAGTATLSQSATVIAHASAMVGNDSAPLHLASLQNVPAIGIFGPTIPAFGFKPFGSVAHVVEHHLECRPCSPHGTSVCPIGTHDCMNLISPAEVHSVVLKAIVLSTP
jgi:heptosyltransferase-2